MTKEDYDKKFVSNTKYSGNGLSTTIHMPCPFCAEPDFRVFRIVDTEKANQDEAVCKSCGRGCKMLYERTDGLGGGVSFEMVQTRGDDPPEYLPPMRRV